MNIYRLLFTNIKYDSLWCKNKLVNSDVILQISGKLNWFYRPTCRHALQHTLGNELKCKHAPFWWRIWDHLALLGEFFHPRTRPPPAPSSSPGNTTETRICSYEPATLSKLTSLTTNSCQQPWQKISAKYQTTSNKNKSLNHFSGKGKERLE